MSFLTALIDLFRTDEEGQGLAEYALILALIAIVAIVALIFLGGQVSDDPLGRRQLGLASSRTMFSEAGPTGPASLHRLARRTSRPRRQAAGRHSGIGRRGRGNAEGAAAQSLRSDSRPGRQSGIQQLPRERETPQGRR